jgi:hypothetical protein
MLVAKAHLRYILLHQGAVAVVMNFVMNGLMAWLIFRPAETVPLWGDGGFAFDIVMTTFFFTFFTSFFVSKATYRKAWSGELAGIVWPLGSRLFKRFPPRPFMGSLV